MLTAAFTALFVTAPVLGAPAVDLAPFIAAPWFNVSALVAAVLVALRVDRRVVAAIKQESAPALTAK